MNKELYLISKIPVKNACETGCVSDSSSSSSHPMETMLKPHLLPLLPPNACPEFNPVPHILYLPWTVIFCKNLYF